MVLAGVSFQEMACSATDRPDHKNALTQIMSQLSDPSYSITKLQYANGFEKDQNNYIVLATYTRVFKVSASTFAKSISDSDNPLVRWAQSVAVSSVYGHFEPGDSFDESAKFRFLRTENGWVLQGFEGDEVIEARHAERADALDAQKKLLDEQRAQEQKVQQQKAQEAAQVAANAAANERERHLIEVKNACASGQQMKIIGYGLLSIEALQGTGAKYLGEGQLVVGVPDDASSLAAVKALLNPPPSFIDGAVRPKYGTEDAILREWLRGKCRVQYSAGNRTSSGYVPVERLGLLQQGDAKAQSNPGAMSGNGEASATTLAVIAQVGFPYSASPQDIYRKPPLGQVGFNDHLCLKKEMLTWNGLKFLQFILPSGKTVYAENLLFQQGSLARDPAGDNNCASQGTTSSEKLDKP